MMRTKTLPIIFISGYRDVPSTVRAIKAGAIDFLTKPVRRETLLNAIENALAHDARERASREQLKHWHAYYDTLTPRELEVFNRVITGKMNKEIASELNAAERTVKAHRAQVMRKMHASSLAELVHIADHLDAAGISLRPGAKG
jgi:FixJ family two-component response regulator